MADNPTGVEAPPSRKLLQILSGSTTATRATSAATPPTKTPLASNSIGSGTNHNAHDARNSIQLSKLDNRTNTHLNDRNRDSNTTNNDATHLGEHANEDAHDERDGQRQQQQPHVGAPASSASALSSLSSNRLLKKFSFTPKARAASSTAKLPYRYMEVAAPPSSAQNADHQSGGDDDDHNHGNNNNDDARAANDIADHDNTPKIQQPQQQTKESNLIVGLKLFAIFSTLYFFMWSSSILSQAFNLTSYHYAGHFIRTSGFLQNPLIGLMVGVITTVIFQSSGAVTSVLVTIVGSGVLSVRQSIPIIMGANLGTSVTNTIVSLIVFRNKQNFEIAMTAGIVHDMYNMMSVVFMLPLELLFHPLENISAWMLSLIGTDRHAEIGELQFLSYLVKPLVDVVIMIDEDKTKNLSPDTIVSSDVSLVKHCCNYERRGNETICYETCRSLFSQLNLSDNVICILLSIIAMVTLFTCLIFVVKVTKSLLGGKLLNWVATLARREYKFPYSMFVGYLFILVGMIITIILHSSGVFTSMLVPLAGGDVLNLMQIYELTLGSNVGTTTTGILASLSAQSKYPVQTLQVALCHFIFNVAGILMFYTFPHTTLPIEASKKFGMMSAKNMWFSICYLIIVFLVAPSLTMLIYFTTQTS